MKMKPWVVWWIWLFLLNASYMPKGGRLSEWEVESGERSKHSPVTSVPEIPSGLKPKREAAFWVWSWWLGGCDGWCSWGEREKPNKFIEAIYLSMLLMFDC